MAMTPEAKVKKRITTMLKSYGVYYFFPVTGGFGRSGVFDIVACIAGRFVGIEVKADSKCKPTVLQTMNAKEAYSCGAYALLIHSGNIDTLDSVLKELKANESSRLDGMYLWPADRT